MIGIYDYSNYSTFLKELLAERQKQNKAYSLRAMALSLGVSHSTLSDVMKGKKNLSEETAEIMAQNLKLNGRKARYFNTLVKLQTTKNKDFKQILLNQLKVLNPKLREHFDVDMDSYRFMTEWYYPAILEMTHLTGQKLTPETIVQRLEISLEVANSALLLLQRLKLLEKTDDGFYKKTKNQFKFQSGEQTSSSLKKYYHQMLNRVQENLRTQPPQERIIGAENFPISLDDYSEAQDIIELCFQQILELSKRSQNKTQVCHLGIQLIKLTKD